MVHECDINEVSFMFADGIKEGLYFGIKKSPRKFYKVTLNNQIVGFIETATISKNKIRITNVYVLPGFRRQGLATKLIKHVIENKTMDVYTYYKTLFETTGFVVQKQYMNKQGDATYYMRKESCSEHI